MSPSSCVSCRGCRPSTSWPNRFWPWAVPRTRRGRGPKPCWTGCASRQALWSLSPTTFSGGEQQRVNIARGFAHAYPALLLDEPTASLDATNRETVLSLIEEAKARGAAIVGIFHDVAARARVADREIDVSRLRAGGGGMSHGRLIGSSGPPAWARTA
jgi:ABC-type iron transport system FetAB ATPase subunit